MQKFVQKCQSGLGVTTRKGSKTRHENEVDLTHNENSEQVRLAHSPVPGPSKQTSKTSPHIPWVRDEQGTSNTEEKKHFAEKTVIFENENIEIYVKKEMFKRQKLFRLDDHLFVLKAKVKETKAPLITSVLDVLKKCFLFMANNLKTFYDPTHKNLVYMSIFQHPMTK